MLDRVMLTTFWEPDLDNTQWLSDRSSGHQEDIRWENCLMDSEGEEENCPTAKQGEDRVGER